MSSPLDPDDDLAAALKGALGPAFAEVGRPPAGGAQTAAESGRRRRRVRRIQLAVSVALVVLVALLVAVAVAVAGTDPRGASPAGSGDPARAEVPAPSDSSSSTTTESSPGVTAPPTTPTAAEGAGRGPGTAGGSGPQPTTPQPTTTQPAAPTTSTTTPPGPQLEVLVSTSPDRSGPIPLDGATISGVVYVFYDDAGHPPTGPTVSFWIDDPTHAGAPHRVESQSPFDLEATAPGDLANPYDTTLLGPGQHTVSVDAGPGAVTVATFTVV
jgi:uncharacterized RDD family membrane protein YckC